MQALIPSTYYLCDMSTEELEAFSDKREQMDGFVLVFEGKEYQAIEGLLTFDTEYGTAVIKPRQKKTRDVSPSYSILLTLDDGGKYQTDHPRAQIGLYGIKSAAIKPAGTIYIDHNGMFDVKEYAKANVATPSPSGSISIKGNGTYDVELYQNAVVNVPPSQAEPEFAKILVVSPSVSDLTVTSLTSENNKIIEETVTIPAGSSKEINALFANYTTSLARVGYARIRAGREIYSITANDGGSITTVQEIDRAERLVRFVFSGWTTATQPTITVAIL